MAQQRNPDLQLVKPEYIEVYCKCGALMELTQPRDCVISIGLQCNNKKCKKIILSNEWFYHCPKDPSDAKVHNNPWNYCNKCANLKCEIIKKRNHYTYLKEGWLFKKPTNHWIKNKDFKRRYFKLSADWKLWYFVNEKDLYNKDVIDLNFMSKIKKKSYDAIEIYETKGQNEWLFLADDQKERDEWYDLMLLAYQCKGTYNQKLKNYANNDNTVYGLDALE